MGQRLDAGVFLGDHGGWGLAMLVPPEAWKRGEFPEGSAGTVGRGPRGDPTSTEASRGSSSPSVR